MNERDFLATVEIFNGLRSDELDRFQEISRPERRAQGDRIFGKGQWAENLYITIHGQIELRIELPRPLATVDLTVSTIRPGGTFGWSALVPPYRYTLSSYASSPECEVLRIGSKDIFNLFDDQPRIGYVFMRNLARVIGKRFYDIQEQMLRRTPPPEESPSHHTEP